jgi:LmbE family N-acetylglucosaminyl deacetylase
VAPWRADWVCYYFINDAVPPSFIIDVSAHYDRKRDALDCHASQFAPKDVDAVGTRLTAASFRQLIETRDAQFGARAGVAFAEGLIVRDPVVRTSLLKDLS